MLKVRIVPILLLKGASVVKSIAFDNHRVVGDAISAIKVFSQRFADEMLILDLDARERGTINSDLLAKAAAFCNMPLAFGGGVNSLDKADILYESGADKIVVNSIFFSDQSVVEKIVEKFGTQAVILSLDVKRFGNGYRVYSENGTNLVKDMDLARALALAQKLGVGEILINDIQKDGSMEGFDLGLIGQARDLTSVPLLVAGGCGSTEDFKEAFKLGVDAVCAGSIFHWVGESIFGIKTVLHGDGIKVRVI